MVNNIIKHSNAGHALVQFHIQDELLMVTVDDDGTRAPELPQPGVGNTGGIGLQNLNDRVRLLHGTLEIEHKKGTSIYLEFPLKKFVRKPVGL